MVKKTITKKAFFNKRTKQLSVTIPKKEFKKMDSKLKFGEDVFVKLEILKKKRSK
ncbi:unnamed protein product [marine sediment metagenome]|uniref:Uncharacterized protein n=1 Tax=marine sediment metagenome TaxID=412755 RepID=X1KDX4_9ZZZZ